MPDTIELLAAVPLFKDLSKRELAQIARSAKEVDHPAGSPVLEKGSSGVGFHIILEGQAAVMIDGERQAQAGQGDYFGEMSLLDGEPRSATVQAETDVKTLTIASWDFIPLIEKHPSIAVKLLAELSRRIRTYQSSARH